MPLSSNRSRVQVLWIDHNPSLIAYFSSVDRQQDRANGSHRSSAIYKDHAVAKGVGDQRTEHEQAPENQIQGAHDVILHRIPVFAVFGHMIDGRAHILEQGVNRFLVLRRYALVE